MGKALFDNRFYKIPYFCIIPFSRFSKSIFSLVQRLLYGDIKQYVPLFVTNSLFKLQRSARG